MSQRTLARWGLVSLVVAVACARGAVARASCAAPSPAIVWSYPADGQVDVPTNAHLFILPTLGTQLQGVFVNDQAAPAADFGFAPALQPNTEYVVIAPINYPDQATVGLSFRFTTGAGPATPAAPAPLHIDNVVTTTSARSLSAQCQDAVTAMDCFDTGQNTTVIFQTQAQPTVFFVAPLSNQLPWTMTWPGGCGSPEVFVSSCYGRYRVYAVDATGVAQTADVGCGASGDGPPLPFSCAVAPGPRDTLVGVLLCMGLGLWLAARGWASRAVHRGRL